MTYEEFRQYVCKGMYETIYDDSEGREILIIEMLDAYDMMNKAPRKWAGLTDAEMKQTCYEACSYDPYTIAQAIEAKLKEKNT